MGFVLSSSGSEGCPVSPARVLRRRWAANPLGFLLVSTAKMRALPISLVARGTLTVQVAPEVMTIAPLLYTYGHA
jgi:hypothetical protein